jgi:N utilization substance protein B
MGHRRKSREYALQALYMCELRSTELNLSKSDLLENAESLEWVDVDISEPIRTFAIDLIKGTVEKITEIDDLIDKYSKNWKLERLSIVDKSILRMAIYEMLNSDGTHPAIIINEAIEIAKIYGGDGSVRFINGILDAINKSHISTISTENNSGND